MATSLSMPELERIMGKEGAALLIQKWGGQLRSIPKTPSEVLIECVGEESADELCKHYGGENVTLPCRPKPPTLKERIIVLINQGYSHNEIADMLSCTGRYSSIVKEMMTSSQKNERGMSPALRARLRRVDAKNVGVARLPM